MKHFHVYKFRTIVLREAQLVRADTSEEALAVAQLRMDQGLGGIEEVWDVIGDEEWEVEPCEQ